MKYNDGQSHQDIYDKEYDENIGQLANMIYCAHENLPITNDDSLTFSNKRL